MSGVLFRVALKLDISRVHLHFKYRVCTSRIQYSLVGNYLGGNYFGDFCGLSQALPCPLRFPTESTQFPHLTGRGALGYAPGSLLRKTVTEEQRFPDRLSFLHQLNTLWCNLKLSPFNFPKVCVLIGDFLTSFFHSTEDKGAGHLTLFVVFQLATGG